ncbi:MAG: MarR family transcriptional regulator [Flavobacteriales bacterium]|jgi:DNA-binding MarR family transcriptional regulator|nr:MarR family transcriptional regulator [Flavobacteriales bacterium]MBK7246971.1 MarR family transcriptional regulator [Flavobacteriales bacterium]MBK7287342.1 MarR family transcriptional regulator [Flavobacteriales bacterium]MBK9599154.1 MarR family transcriptional regulator [Flavobacteriales bacterium]QQS72630.1 MAG: MarR family transcriptional regulator [Flavobacteriales bacterium]
MSSTPELDAHLAQVLERIGEVARALRWKQAVEEGLSPLQIRIMGFLADHADESIGVARLAEELLVSKPTISDSVKLLADRKFLIRKPDKSDARSHALQLTAAGRRHVSAGTPMDTAVAELSLEHKEALLTGLMGVLESLFRKEAVHVQRMCFTCKYYRGDRSVEHRCLLLEKSLPVAELRTDCAEHEVVE